MFTPNDPLTRECPTKGDRYRTSIAPAEMPYITRGVTTQKIDYRKGIPDGFEIIIGFNNTKTTSNKSRYVIRSRNRNKQVNLC